MVYKIVYCIAVPLCYFVASIAVAAVWVYYILKYVAWRIGCFFAP